ncbi:MAG: penicillin-binding transpeptidase domain-containing protein [Minisyncoccia bacterium]
MYNRLFRKIRKSITRKYKDIDPEDIFLDSTNLPGFTINRFEGRIEKPISSVTFLLMKGALVLLLAFFFVRLWNLNVINGENFNKISENNRLAHTLIFANRGVVYDRNKVELATNAIKEGKTDFAERLYAPIDGLSHVVGYVKYPSKDSSGFYYEEEYRGQSGVEKTYNSILAGTNGLKITETDALGHVTSESVVRKPEDGQDLILSIDARLNAELYKAMKDIKETRGFTGGAGAIMDVNSGEILALSSFPGFDQNLVTRGEDKKEISRLLTSKDKPFLDRAVSGLYTPGSIVKPIMALAALNENVISPDKQILSTGTLLVPNPYDKTKPSIFKDWRINGWTDMREALAVSSDIYFYVVGGGFEGQKGLGINNIDRYFEMFGMTEKTGIDLPGENEGVIPSPEWKKENFDGEPWRLGDTYITSIGQYGTQVTLLEALRWTASIANKGTLLIPSVVLGGKSPNSRVFRTIDLPDNVWKVVQEGMKQGVETGIVSALKTPAVAVAAKTGTAELGASKNRVNSWSVGFFPFEHPHYAFAVLMENGPADNPVGATYAMQELLNWMILNTPEYTK